MKPLLLTLLTCCLICRLHSQTTERTDSTKELQLVIVKAYGQNRQLKEVSAAVNYIGQSQLERYNNTSILPALNATPGVHMEERSPGSYRLNVRGSTLRSPFGVRNVKVYWNGIPFTDPGGNTYLNQLSYYNVGSIEVIKGPASSLYGAGTGGAMLINSQPQDWNPGLDLHYVTGSFNLQNFDVQGRVGKEDHRNYIGYAHQTSDGYRDHTNMRRDVATWETKIKTGEKAQLGASVLYGDLYYQTPGGLTKAEYTSNPKAARPAAGAFPSAEGAKAAIYQQTFLAGITHDYQFNEHLQNSTVVYGAFSLIKNPTFRNYERRTEPHFGGRTVFTWEQQSGNTDFKLLFGGEAQRGFFNTKTFKNNQGNPDSILTDDDIQNLVYSAFAQGEIRFTGDWSITGGVSINQSGIRITRLSVPLFTPVKRTYKSELAPRISVSKKIIPELLFYVSAAKGFSPPTAQEVLPSTSVISAGLEAEEGVDMEAGFKSSWLRQRLYIEVNGFYYKLKNAIVQRRDASNADYFINAGSTKQWGIESHAYYQVFHSNRFIQDFRIWISHTFNKFRYDDFKQINTDFSGKKLPSVAPQIVAGGIDLVTKAGLYTNLNWFYSDPIPLNDANTDVATSYSLAGIRFGWRKPVSKKFSLDLFAGVDNLFDARYSLGNDINATGGRYYNTAAGVNYFAGLAFNFSPTSHMSEK